jgi:hypothetical protein
MIYFIHRFDSDDSAYTALKRLHQLEVLSSRLNVVFAKKKPNEWSEVPETSSDNTEKRQV